MMAPSKPDLTSVKTFADHEVITPPNRLQGAVGRAIDGDDPVARAEAALAQLSSEFSGWMNDECEQLDSARHDVHQNGMAALPGEALFRSAHDIKGQAATLGFPLVADVAGSLCKLLEEAPDPTRIPLALIDQHVDAVRAIIREHGHARAEVVAAALTRTLRQVCDDFLASQQPATSDADG
jgi:HPt (histidine-containing phosphotransfer) domain-containing protein